MPRTKSALFFWMLQFYFPTAKYGIIFQRFFFSLVSPIFWKKKNAINLNFHYYYSIIQALFHIKFSPIWMNKKRNEKESIICFTPKPNQNISEIIRVILWSPSSPDLNPLDYAQWVVLENKTNANFHTNIDSLKTAIVGEWNKMSEEFILKACKSFRRHVDTIIEKMTTILSKVTVLCLSSYFVVYFFKLKLILFYNRVVYYDTRICLILLPHSVYPGVSHNMIWFGLVWFGFFV